MAIVGTQDEDEKNKNQVASPTTSASPNAHAAYDSAQGKPYEGASGGAGFIGGAGQGSTTGVANAASTGAASPNPGGGYANLSQYLAVNQGSGATTGQAAENVVQQSGDAAKSAQNAFSTSGLNDINAATTAAGVNQDVLGKVSGGQANVDQTTLDKINAGGYNYTPDKNVFDNIGAADKSKLDDAIKAGTDASKWAYSGPTDFSKVGYGGPTIDQITTQYGGPNTTSDFKGQTAAQQQAAIAANDTAAGKIKNASGGQTGVSALLKDAYQQPQYTAGENNLDAFLAGGTEGGQAALAQAGGVGQDVTGNYSKISDALNGAIKKGKDTATATNKSYKDAIDAATANSAATQDKYNAAVKAVQDNGATAKASALDAAKKAQTEEDSRAAAAAAAEAARLKAIEDAKKPTVISDIVDTVKKAGGDISDTAKIAGGDIADAAKTAGGQVAAAAKDVIKPVVNDVQSLPQNIVNTPSSIGSDIVGAVQGNQGSLNNLATTVLTAGLNKVAPTSTAAAVAAAAKARDDAAAAAAKARDDAAAAAARALTAIKQQPVKNISNAVASVAKKFHFAHGGEVPSYGKLVSKLRGTR